MTIAIQALDNSVTAVSTALDTLDTKIAARVALGVGPDDTEAKQTATAAVRMARQGVIAAVVDHLSVADNFLRSPGDAIIA